MSPGNRRGGGGVKRKTKDGLRAQNAYCRVL